MLMQCCNPQKITFFVYTIIKEALEEEKTKLKLNDKNRFSILIEYFWFVCFDKRKRICKSFNFKNSTKFKKNEK